jgi:predicted Rossmann fold flavoprotein
MHLLLWYNKTIVDQEENTLTDTSKNKSIESYDVLIVGAGPAGLFAASQIGPVPRGLILFNRKNPGLKLLMAGSGQCNLTRQGDIRDFISHYGPAGKSIRKTLYTWSNLRLIRFMEELGIPLMVREDQKVFPRSLKSRDVLAPLIAKAEANGFRLEGEQTVTGITRKEGHFLVSCGNRVYRAQRVILATGGLSYPESGSDGSIHPVLGLLGIPLTETRPALTPVYVETYPYKDLSGLSFEGVRVRIDGQEETGPLLMTHQCFSGPVILNLSRYASPGKLLEIDWIPGAKDSLLQKEFFSRASQGGREILTDLQDILFESGVSLPRRFLQTFLQLEGIDPSSKSAQCSKKQLLKLFHRFHQDSYRISGTGGYRIAMATRGGVPLSQVHQPSFEAVHCPGLYIIGEALDVDGDTGGYNIQFAYASGSSCGSCIIEALNSN